MLTTCTRNIVTRLQDVINTLTCSRPPALPTTTETAFGNHKIESLVIRAAPERLDEADHPDVPYWDESDWTNHCERQKDRGSPASKLGFLTDEDGSPAVE